MRWMVQAWEEMCERMGMDALFHKVGICLTVEGSTDHLLHIVGVEDYKLAAADAGEHEVVNNSDSKNHGEASKNANEAKECDHTVSASEDNVNDAWKDEQRFETLMNENGECLCPHGLAVVQAPPTF